MTRMLNIREVCDVLGLSYAEVIKLVQSGYLRAYKYVGGLASKDEITFDSRGLRFRNSDIEQMLDASLIN